MLHWIEFIVADSAWISLCLTVLLIVSFNMLWWSVSLWSWSFFSILLGYYGQGTRSFVVFVVYLLFLSCHEVLLFCFICIHVSIKIMIWLSHLIVRVDIIVDLCLNLLMYHSTRVLLITSCWSNFLVLMCKTITSFVVLNLNGADVSSFILFSTMFVPAKVSFARVFNSSCTLMWHLSTSIILLVEEACWREQMTLCWWLIGIQVFKRWNIAVVLESS